MQFLNLFVSKSHELICNIQVCLYYNVICYLRLSRKIPYTNELANDCGQNYYVLSFVLKIEDPSSKQNCTCF